MSTTMRTISSCMYVKLTVMYPHLAPNAASNSARNLRRSSVDLLATFRSLARRSDFWKSGDAISSKSEEKPSSIGAASGVVDVDAVRVGAGRDAIRGAEDIVKARGRVGCGSGMRPIAREFIRCCTDNEKSGVASPRQNAGGTCRSPSVRSQLPQSVRTTPDSSDDCSSHDRRRICIFTVGTLRASIFRACRRGPTVAELTLIIVGHPLVLSFFHGPKHSARTFDCNFFLAHSPV